MCDKLHTVLPRKTKRQPTLIVPGGLLFLGPPAAGPGLPPVEATTPAHSAARDATLSVSISSLAGSVRYPSCNPCHGASGGRGVCLVRQALMQRANY